MYSIYRGGCRQVVTALGCGSSIRGFKSRHSPSLLYIIFFLTSYYINSKFCYIYSTIYIIQENKLNFISFTMLTDNQVFLALFSALVTSILAIRLAATLYQ